MSVDSRREDEHRAVPKSRYSSNSLYISDAEALVEVSVGKSTYGLYL